MPAHKKIIIGAWKAYLNTVGATRLAGQIATWYSKNKINYELVLAPSFIHLMPVKDAISTTSIGLSGQDVDLGSYGAYTGHTVPEMLDDVGCTFVILGHSEVRKYKLQSNMLIRDKIKAILDQSKLRIILCVGESMQEKNENKTVQTLKSQISETLAGLSGALKGRLDIAYEPLWAISSEKPVSPPDAAMVSQIHRSIKGILGDIGSFDARVLYGGSVNKENIRGYLKQGDIDGVLVGSASTKHPQFIDLLEAADDQSALV